MQQSLFEIEDAAQSTSILETIQSMVEQGAVFFCSHSSGKDSAAQYEVIKSLVPHDQIVVVHANLGEVEHPGTENFIRANIDSELHVVRANKTFFEMVLMRSFWPSPKFRQCTSDLKTGPIGKFMRNYLKDRGLKLGVNAMGLRAEESTNRAKRNPFCINTKETPKGDLQLMNAERSFDPKAPIKTRQIWDWLPVFELTTAEVFETITNAGKLPHPAYGYNPVTKQAEGNERLSCLMCIMASTNDLKNGAVNNPDLYAHYVAIEQVIDHTMFAKTVRKVCVPVSLEEKTGIKADPKLVAELIPVIQLQHDEYHRNAA